MSSLLVAFLSTFASRTAHADLRIAWDCYLPGSGVDCAVLKSSLTSKIPFIRVVPRSSNPDVLVTLASVPAEGGTRFVFHFAGRVLDGARTEVRSSEKIPSTVDRAAASVRILTRLERGLDDFMSQEESGDFGGGQLVLRLTDPGIRPFSGRPEQSAIPWYVSPSVGAQMSDVQGVGVNASGDSVLFFNYSAQSWRLQQSMGGNFAQLSQPVPATGETASVRFAGAFARNTLAWSLTADHRFTFGLLFAGERNPQANYAIRANASAGVEFNLVPRQTSGQKNLGFRCAIGPEAERFDTANTEGKLQVVFVRPFCDLYLGWHFEAIDLGASVSGNAILGSWDYRSVNVGFGATWRVTDDISIAPWIGLQQIEKAINEARDVPAPPGSPREEIEASIRASVQRGYTAPLSVRTGLSIRYVFGNGSLNSEDQRWKGASNLR